MTKRVNTALVRRASILRKRKSLTLEIVKKIYYLFFDTQKKENMTKRLMGEKNDGQKEID